MAAPLTKAMIDPIHDTLRGPVYDFVETMAQPKANGAKPKVDIGSKWTGKREYHWDSRTGTYSESMPILSYDEWLIQRALCPDLLLLKRKAKDIRQQPA